MIDKARIIQAIRKGDWIIEHILPSFRTALIKDSDHLVLASPSTLVRSLAFYNSGISIEDLGALMSNTRPAFMGSGDLATLSISSWFTKLISGFFPESQVISFSTSETDKIVAARSEVIRVAPELTSLLQTQEVYVRLDRPFMGASHPKTFGMVFFGNFLMNQPTSQAAISIVHELAHHELFLINLIDRLIDESFDRSEKFSPLQKKSRPPIGRLHALYALFRMTQFMAVAGHEISENRQKIGETIDTFESRELTEFSQQLLEAIGSSVRSLPT